MLEMAKNSSEEIQRYLLEKYKVIFIFTVDTLSQSCMKLLFRKQKGSVHRRLQNHTKMTVRILLLKQL